MSVIQILARTEVHVKTLRTNTNVCAVPATLESAVTLM